MFDYIEDIIADLEILASRSREDFENRFWDNYVTYLNQYNAILGRLHAQGEFLELPEISPVPDGQKAHLGIGFTSAEHAKLREVGNAAQGLLNRLRGAGSLRDIPEGGSDKVEKLCSRFHTVAGQLEKRHSGRGTLVINDEYDVQDLLHALLKLDFDDVRNEEWTPSYGGGAARMDFLLKKEQIVIEVKMTRVGLGERELGNQLIVDIAKYKGHPDCRTLVCFVYDPDHVLSNPRGLEADLEKLGNGIGVRVLIRPSGE